MARSSSPQRTPWRLLVAATLAWGAALFVAFRPGLMSIDSVVQYGQGLDLAFSNQHPPLGSIVYGLSGRLVGSPALALGLQLALVGGGFALLVRPALVRGGAAAALALAVALAFLAAPSTWAIAVVLWKDVLFAGALLLACAALRARFAFVALTLLGVAALLRHDAIFATAPLAVAAAWTAPALRTRAGRIAITAAAIVAMIALPRVFERALGARDVWPVGQLFVYDLAGVYVREPEGFAKSSLARDVSLEELRALYTPLTGGPLLFPKPGERGVSFHRLAERRGLAQEWLHAVAAHPRAYAAHRWAAFAALLGLEPGPAFAPYHDRIDSNPWGFRLTKGAVYTALARWRDAARDGPLLRGWFWLAAAAAAALVSLARARRDPVPFFIALSGICYAAAHLVTSVSAELRYVYWTALSPFAAAAAALAFRSTAHWDRPPTISTRLSAK